uniref:Uncharacterized protein n=1 Tax=Anopheles minimus TaxID=112268 RepID=A0A182WN57_9DIPT
MRVTSESNSGPPSRTPSIMDSPTLVRVERARLRQEADSNGQRPGSGQREDSLERCLLDPKKTRYTKDVDDKPLRIGCTCVRFRLSSAGCSST